VPEREAEVTYVMGVNWSRFIAVILQEPRALNSSGEGVKRKQEREEQGATHLGMGGYTAEKGVQKSNNDATASYGGRKS